MASESMSSVFAVLSIIILAVLFVRFVRFCLIIKARRMQRSLQASSPSGPAPIIYNVDIAENLPENARVSRNQVDIIVEDLPAYQPKSVTDTIPGENDAAPNYEDIVFGTSNPPIPNSNEGSSIAPNNSNRTDTLTPPSS
ncbi:hypothetical protein HK098_000515 [Nowakowskiella sp. JEL0407]|nr:hypothetical protein HK098_000515 [Nowakowskiella sp. JEL0407]